MAQADSERIRDLNDAFRKNPASGQGRLMLTDGVAERGNDFVSGALAALSAFNTFTPDNDPHGEHDFGIFSVDGIKLYFKIDYYDADCAAGSEDPSNPAVTTRVLTILLPEEY